MDHLRRDIGQDIGQDFGKVDEPQLKAMFCRRGPRRAQAGLL
jgi:hypothetical protein